MKKLLIISSYIDEKPTGGVTMHVHRLLKSVVEPFVPKYDTCDYKNDSCINQLKKIKKADVMHIHASNPFLKLLYVISGKLLNTKSVITVHGRYGVYGRFKDIVHRIALKLCDVPVLINKESYKEVLRFNRNAVFIPAFIPPIKEEEVLPNSVKVSIEGFMEEGMPFFITNASSRAFTSDGKEIYGIDFLISFFGYHPEYKLVIQDPKGQYEDYYGNNLPDNIMIISGNYSFCGLVELSDLVIRNTPIDGDSLSVKEALCYHKKVLATNAVSRPEGVFLFEYNNKDSLEKAISKALLSEDKLDLQNGDVVLVYYQLYQQMGIGLKEYTI